MCEKCIEACAEYHKAEQEEWVKYQKGMQIAHGGVDKNGNALPHRAWNNREMVLTWEAYNKAIKLARKKYLKAIKRNHP